MRGRWASGAWGAAAAAEEYPLRLWPRGTALQALPAPAAYLGSSPALRAGRPPTRPRQNETQSRSLWTLAQTSAKIAPERHPSGHRPVHQEETCLVQQTGLTWKVRGGEPLQRVTTRGRQKVYRRRSAMPGLDRRQFLGAGAALALTGLPGRASAALIANRSGLPWASGGRDKYPDVLAAYRGRNLDVLTVYGPRGTWSDIRNTGSKLAWLIGQRSETIVISYAMSRTTSARRHMAARSGQGRPTASSTCTTTPPPASPPMRRR